MTHMNDSMPSDAHEDQIRQVSEPVRQMLETLHAKLHSVNERLAGVCAERVAAERAAAELKASEEMLVAERTAALKDFSSAAAAIQQQLDVPQGWVLDLSTMSFVPPSGGKL